MTELQGYEYFTNDRNTYAVDIETGEVTESVILKAPIGTRYYTPKQQAAYAKKKSREQICKQMQSKLGHFYFLFNDNIFDRISPSSVTRLVYLNSFLSYNNNALMISQRTQMNISDLSQVLNVNKSTASRFFNEVAPEYITKDLSLIHI